MLGLCEDVAPRWEAASGLPAARENRRVPPEVAPRTKGAVLAPARLVPAGGAATRSCPRGGSPLAEEDRPLCVPQDNPPRCLGATWGCPRVFLWSPSLLAAIRSGAGSSQPHSKCHQGALGGPRSRFCVLGVVSCPPGAGLCCALGSGLVLGTVHGWELGVWWCCRGSPALSEGLSVSAGMPQARLSMATSWWPSSRRRGRWRGPAVRSHTARRR